MQRIKIAGVCLIAMFAFSAVAVSTAQAGHAYICKKKRKGSYKASNCVTLASPAGTGKFERYEIKSEAFKTKDESLELQLTAAATLQPIDCKKGSGTGEWKGPAEASETVTFVGCTYTGNGEPCNAGTLAFTFTDSLIDRGGKGPAGKEPAEGEAWNMFKSPGDEPYWAKFSCGLGIEFRIKGTVSGVISPVDESVKGITTSYGEGKGEQELTTEFSENAGLTWKPIKTTVWHLTPVAKDPKGTVIDACNELEPECS